jgi:integrative and conjugative element protein (TIGR02256 family)
MAILSETTEKIKTETGGVFLGCYENGTWYVIEAIDPGPKSVFQVAYFEYDRKYTEHLINKIARIYQAKLTLVGLWHRHPGSLDKFSSTDDGTNSDYAKLSPNGAVSVLVNVDPKFRITPYHVAWPLRYTKISYEVGDSLIPEHLQRLKCLEQSEHYINSYADKSHTQRASYAKPKADFIHLLDDVKAKFTPCKVGKDDIKPGESEKHMDFLIDSLLDDITYFTETRGLALKVEQDNGHIALSHKGANGTVTKSYFTYLPHRKLIIFSHGEVFYEYKAGLLSGLLADYVPPEKTFKAGLMQAMGIGKNAQGEQ